MAVAWRVLVERLWLAALGAASQFMAALEIAVAIAVGVEEAELVIVAERI